MIRNAIRTLLLVAALALPAGLAGCIWIEKDDDTAATDAPAVVQAEQA